MHSIDRSKKPAKKRRGISDGGGYTRWIKPFRQPVLIYNPAAGKLRRDPQAILQRTIAALENGGPAPRLLPTSKPDQAGDLARHAVQDGADLVLVLGGDGTINEAAQGLVHTGIPMGVLPGGTANVLAMELGLGSRLERAAQRLTEAEPVPIALGKVSGERYGTRYFLLMCGAGLDAEIITEVSPKLKAMGGKLAYWVAGLAQFRRRLRQGQIQIDGQEHTCGFTLISRVRNYGGDLEIASAASLRNDEFHVVWFQGTNPLRYAGYMLAVAARQVLKMPGVHQARGRSIELLSTAPAQIDGEFVGREPLRIEIEPNALTLLMPRSYQ